MKPTERTARLTIATLLMLAVGLVWPSAGPVVSASHAHLHAMAARIAHEPGMHHKERTDSAVHADREPSGSGCCLMTACHPGLVIAPYGMVFLHANGEGEAAIAAKASGSEPDVAIPPPRILPV